MKKVIIALAVAFSAGLFASCGDTPGCYEITVKWGDSSATGYYYGTKNEVDAFKEKVKAAYTLIDANAKITSTKVFKSQEDCTGGGLRF